jgi:hypothetical protein
MDFTETVDVNKVSCTTNRLYPVLKKDTHGTALCSNVGADGRTDDLLSTVHYVEIGWNMSAMTFVDENHFAPTEIKDMVRLTFFPSIVNIECYKILTLIFII